MYYTTDMNDILTGSKLKAIRAIRGVTQAKLAEYSGISPTAIAEFERGKREMRTGTVAKIFDTLGVTVTLTVDGMTIS